MSSITPTPSREPLIGKAILIVVTFALRCIAPLSLPFSLAFLFSIFLGHPTLPLTSSLFAYAAVESVFWLDYCRRKAKLEREDGQLRWAPTRSERERLFLRSVEGFERGPGESFVAWFDHVGLEERPVKTSDMKRTNVEELLAGECLAVCKSRELRERT
jgi:hypothetical protein